ncbi:MAG TPA: hypothetical protein VD931_17350 [Baekduia sp.]|nr:hypothetical protein [Baekduia sp.]
MGLVYAITLGLAAWLVLWSLGAKAIDGMLLATVIILAAQMVRMLILHGPVGRRQ